MVLDGEAQAERQTTKRRTNWERDIGSCSFIYKSLCPGLPHYVLINDHSYKVNPSPELFAETPAFSKETYSSGFNSLVNLGLIPTIPA